MDVTGIVIKSVDYADRDKIITIACPDGLYSVRAKGVRSASSKLKGAVVLLSFGEFSLVAGRAGYTLSGADISENFYNCWSDPDKYAAAIMCVEMYEKLIKTGEEVALSDLLIALKNINFGEFYAPAEALRYGVTLAAGAGVDVAEGVFPEKISDIFASLLHCDCADKALTEYTQSDVKLFLKHLYNGFLSELGIKLTVVSKL